MARLFVWFLIFIVEVMVAGGLFTLMYMIHPYLFWASFVISVVYVLIKLIGYIYDRKRN